MTEKNDPRDRSALDDLRIVDPGALQGDPFARKSDVLSSLRASGRGWVAAAIAVGVLVLAWRFSVPVSQQVAGAPAASAGANAPASSGAPAASNAPAAPSGAPGSTGSVRLAESATPAAASSQATAPSQAGATVRLQSSNPTELKAKLVDELRAAGVEAIGYDRLDLSGVDAKLPDPVPSPVQAVLNRHGIPLPADGVVRVEIAQSR